MIRITQKSYRNLIFFCDLFNDGYHRAAIGMTEATDAVTLIVSEETGIISMAREGRLTRHLDRAGLEQVLTALYQPKETGLLSSLMEKTKRRKGDAA